MQSGRGRRRERPGWQGRRETGRSDPADSAEERGLRGAGLQTGQMREEKPCWQSERERSGPADRVDEEVAARMAGLRREGPEPAHTAALELTKSKAQGALPPLPDSEPARANSDPAYATEPASRAGFGATVRADSRIRR